jgi:hypothetical protein
MTFSHTFQVDKRIPEATFAMKIAPIVGTAIHLTEILFYILIYADISGHDKTMLNSSIISREVYNKRQGKNSFTLMSQIACFTAESLFTFHIIFLNVLGTKLSMKEISFISRVPQFAFLTAVKIATSNEMRQTIFERLSRFWLIFECHNAQNDDIEHNS